MPEPRRTVRVTDPLAMRALAHPTRLRLLGELRIRGPQTVGMLSDVIDEAVGSVSYHLGKLATHGFVREAPELARDRRERWWRAAHSETSWDPTDALVDPERRAASALLRRSILGRYQDLLLDYLDTEQTLAPEWVRGMASGDATIQLTSGELVELHAELEALVARWRERGSADRPDARPVTVIYHAFRRPQ